MTLTGGSIHKVGNNLRIFFDFIPEQFSLSNGTDGQQYEDYRLHIVRN